MFRLGYNTNGCPHHRVEDALRMLAGLGYEAVSITPDAGLLDPYALAPDEVARVRALADELGLELTVETGSRFLLDPLRKHHPTLLAEEAADRARRVDFLERCVDLAADLGASVVSLWAGAAPDGSVGDRRGGSDAPDVLWRRLCAGLRPVLARGEGQGVQIAFEPEPGMFVERPDGYGELVARLGADGETLGLCLDVGHLLCTGDLPVPDVIERWAHRLVLVQLDDARGGVHEHLVPGTGDLDLPGTLRALVAVGFDGVAAVELSRDGHRAPQAAAEALRRIREAFGAPEPRRPPG